MASLGGRARAEALRLKRMLGLSEPAEPYRAYLAHAAEWRDAQLRHLAESVGGGVVGPDVLAIVSTAARQLAASLALNDAALAPDCEDPVPLLEKSSRLGNDSRQNLLAAHELAARAAKTRPLANPHAAVLEAFGGGRVDPSAPTRVSTTAARGSEYRDGGKQ